MPIIQKIRDYVNEDRVTVQELYLAAPKTISKFTSSGTWTKPNGCILVYVQVVGAGGGGAGYGESGGAGGFCESYLDVTDISTVTVTVGTGGGAVTYYGQGGNGGASSFGGYVTTFGGFGANRLDAHSGGGGGKGQFGQHNIHGGGGTGHANHAGTTTHSLDGIAGGSFFGGAAADRRGVNNTGQPPGAPGSGGVGAESYRGWAGIPGQAGMVIVHEFYQE